MLKKLIVVTLIVSLFVVGVVVVSAQDGNGNGRGPGQGGRGRGTSTGMTTPNNDSSSYVPAQTGQRRGQMNQANGQSGNQLNGQSQMNQTAGQPGAGLYATLPPASTDELPQEVIDLMIAGWLDEQHAYAVYESIMTQFGEVAPFVNIQQAEVQHAAAWEFLFDRYGIPVPNVPEFDIPSFASLEDACAQGAAAEIANFELYDTMLATFTDYPDIYQIVQALRDASEFQHLPAFQTCAGS